LHKLFVPRQAAALPDTENHGEGDPKQQSQHDPADGRTYEEQRLTTDQEKNAHNGQNEPRNVESPENQIKEAAIENENGG
jgi:hypothetical protein